MSFRVLCGVTTIACLLMPLAPVRGQRSTSSIEQKELEVQKKEAELKQRELELARKQSELEKARQELQAQQSGRSLSMNLSGDVLFDYDKATLKPAAQEALNKVAVVLSQFPESRVTVEGYTDAKGTKSVNMQLSQERALAVKDWLVKSGSVPAVNISARGFGEQNPVAPNTRPDGSDDRIGRAANRRVSIIVEKAAEATPAPISP
jgi:outer membrane protein OmpA-like peptidoglycan-associated protein